MISNAPFLRIILPFIAGILLAVYLHMPFSYAMPVFIVLFLMVGTDIFWWKISKKYKFRYLTALTYFFLMLSFGASILGYHNIYENKDHIRKFPGALKISAHIIEQPVEKEKSYKAVMCVDAVFGGNKWQKASGKIIVYFKKDSLSSGLKFGDQIIMPNLLKEIDPPKNPGQFNYKQYLAFHGVYHQQFMSTGKWIHAGRKPAFIMNFAGDLRVKMMNLLRENGLQGEELAVAGALVLGITDYLDDELVRAYSSSGALHVLSVSGLHVGIIYLVLSKLLSFLDKRKRGAFLKGILLLLLIWFYALITGLSPSVLRSATMFSFIIIGSALHRNSSIYNSIAASAFILLCINPYLIMEVGFQLSYLAVCGIVYLQPIIYSWFYFRNRIMDEIWKITAVSLAAQVATFPLGLLYFHQFPNYFLVSNLVVIPLSTIILYAGIVMMIFSFIPVVSKALGVLLSWMVFALNWSVKEVDSWPYALYEGVSITTFETWIMYAIIILFFGVFIYKRMRFLKYSMAFMVCMLVMQSFENNACERQRKLIIYDMPESAAIDLVHGKSHVFICEKKMYDNESIMLFNVKHNWDNLALSKEKPLFLDDSVLSYHNNFMLMKNRCIRFEGKTIFIADEFYNYRIKLKLKQIDYLLLTGNPRISLKKFTEVYHVKKMLISSDNTFRKKNYFKAEAEKLKIPLHILNDDGAFMVDFSD